MTQWRWCRSVRFLAILPMLGIVAGCGGTPNTSPTQTRTAEIIEASVAAQLAPTSAPAATSAPAPAPTIAAATANTLRSNPPTATAVPSPTSAPATAAPASSGSAQPDFDLYWNKIGVTRSAPGSPGYQYVSIGVLWNAYVSSLQQVVTDYDKINRENLLNPKDYENYGKNHKLFDARVSSFQFLGVDIYGIDANSTNNYKLREATGFPPSMQPLVDLMKKASKDSMDFLNVAETEDTPYSQAHKDKMESLFRLLLPDVDAVSAFVRQYCSQCAPQIAR